MKQGVDFSSSGTQRMDETARKCDERFSTQVALSRAIGFVTLRRFEFHPAGPAPIPA